MAVIVTPEEHGVDEESQMLRIDVRDTEKASHQVIFHILGIASSGEKTLESATELGLVSA